MNQVCLEFFRRSNFPPEAAAAVSELEVPLHTAADLDDLRCRFFRGDDTVWSDLHTAAEQADLHPYAADLLFLLHCLPEAKSHYEQANISQEVYWDSMKDICCKMTETHQVYGIWGVYCGQWLSLLLTHKLVCLGRLQFEIQPSHCGCTIGEHTIRKGDLLLNVHIPSFGRLLYEDVLDAYRRAERFFRDQFPEGPIWIQCETWILYPPVLERIPAGNLRTWAEDYQVVHACIDPNQDDRYRIFGLPAQVPVEAYPETNQLQRSLKAWLLAGNRMGIGFGYALIQDGSLIKA